MCRSGWNHVRRDRCPGLLSETVGRRRLRPLLTSAPLQAAPTTEASPEQRSGSDRDGHISEGIVRPAFPLERRSANGCEGSRLSASTTSLLLTPTSLLSGSLPHSAEGSEHIVSQRQYQAARCPAPSDHRGCCDSLGSGSCLSDSFGRLPPACGARCRGADSPGHSRREVERPRYSGSSKKTIGCAICELPTMPPSVPGLRLLHRLEDHLIGLGVELCTGFAVQRLCLDGDRCIGVELDTPGRPRTIRAGSVVLASGRFSNLLEPCESSALRSRETMQVDHEFHPLNSKGEVVANNLFACGSGLGSGEPRHGNAVAIITGYQAAMIASQTGVEYAAR